MVTSDIIPVATIEEHPEEREALAIFINKTLVDIEIQFSSNIRIVHEEVLILDGIGLLGSLGGSLGLFIGFSFFGYVSKAIDAFLNLITPKLIKAENEIK